MVKQDSSSDSSREERRQSGRQKELGGGPEALGLIQANRKEQPADIDPVGVLPNVSFDSVGGLAHR